MFNRFNVHLISELQKKLWTLTMEQEEARIENEKLKKDNNNTNRMLKTERRRVKYYQRLHMEAKQKLAHEEKVSENRRKVMASLV